jgi:TonB-dependent starch-binding outer membrane protein SusC
MKASLLFLLMSISLASFSQTRITGKVLDENNQPMPGVSILIKGTSQGATTESDGTFSLESAEPNPVLTISFIGYVTQELTAAAGSPIEIRMVVDVQQIEELVVVGYGEQKKSVVTGAISSVKSKDLENMPVVRIEQSLQGRTAGLIITQSSGQPGASATVRVRGTTSINGSEPVYIVDNVQINGGIEYLNQADIESIEVLKDAASAAIYGARGAAGVIIVTTKKGKSGQLNVNYNGYIGFQQTWRRMKLLNATEYATLYNEAAVASGAPIRYPDPSALGKGTDWQDAVFNDSAPIQNHEVSVSGGNDKSTFFGSFGHFDQEGIIASDDSRFKRFTARLNATHKISRYVTFGHNIGYTRIGARDIGTNGEFGTALGRAVNMDPITPVIMTDPAVLNDPTSIYNTQPVVRDDRGRPYGISELITSEILNPVAALKVNQAKNWSDKVVGNAFLEVMPIEGLKFRSSIGVDLAFWGGESFSPVFYLNGTNQNVLNDYSRNQSRGLFWLFENTVSYSKSIEKHNFTALVGTGAQHNYGETVGGMISGIPVTNLRDASLSFPVPQENQFFWGSEYKNTLSSLFARLTYDFDEKYLFTGIIRRDGSSKFGPNNKYGVFPSASVGWVASREDFWPENLVVNFLKIRSSYGVNGSNNLNDFLYLATVGGGRNYTFGTGETISLVNGVSPNAISNPDLKWEETSQFDIGFDATVLNDFTVTFDFFSKKTTGMLLGVDVPWYVGNGGPVGNIADMTNTGYELELGYAKTIGDLSFRVNGNITYLKNEVTHLGEDKTFLGGQNYGPQGVQLTRTEIGRPVGFLYGYKTNGIFQTQEQIESYVNADGDLLQPDAVPGDVRYVDYDNNGVIDGNDRTMIGDPTPDWTFGFTASANWKGLDIVLFGQGVAGNDVYQAVRRFDLPTANWSRDALNRWTGPGTSNSFPRLTLNDLNQNFSRSNDLNVKDGSYFRIKTLQIGYSLPMSIIERAGLNKFRIYVMANNLVTFTRYGGFDPEIVGGVDRGLYPQPRAYMIGLNIGF